MPRENKTLILTALFTMLFGCTSEPSGDPLPNGRLRPCPDRPNCVSSETEKNASAWVAPLTFQEDPEKAWDHLQAVIRGMGGAIEQETPDYLWATFTSRIFHFVDDVEFRMEAQQGVIQVRSGSRLGYSDQGVNRKRVEALRKRFEKSP